MEIFIGHCSTYYGISRTNGIMTNLYLLRLSLGTVYLTEEEAKFALEKMKVIAELKRYSREFVVGDDNFSNC